MRRKRDGMRSDGRKRREKVLEEIEARGEGEEWGMMGRKFGMMSVTEKGDGT